jgi:hypothetical protein
VEYQLAVVVLMHCINKRTVLFIFMFRYCVIVVIISLFYDGSKCHNMIATSPTMSSRFMTKIFVTKFLPCHLPRHLIYDKHIRHKVFATSPATSSAAWQCLMLRFVTFFDPVYDDLERHRFNDEHVVRH